MVLEDTQNLCNDYPSDQWTNILATNGLSAFWYALKEYDVNVAALYGVFGFFIGFIPLLVSIFIVLMANRIIAFIPSITGVKSEACYEIICIFTSLCVYGFYAYITIGLALMIRAGGL